MFHGFDLGNIAELFNNAVESINTITNLLISKNIRLYGPLNAPRAAEIFIDRKRWEPIRFQHLALP